MTVSSSVLALPAVGHDGGMDSSRRGQGGPTRRRTFTPAERLTHIDRYEAACEHQFGSGMNSFVQREVAAVKWPLWSWGCDGCVVPGRSSSRSGMQAASAFYDVVPQRWIS